MEIIPEHEIDGAGIRKMIKTEKPDNSKIIFEAGNFARFNGIEDARFIENLYRELSIESEKNWHDTVFFEILIGKETIAFQLKAGERK
jgi:hypothetical protein